MSAEPRPNSDASADAGDHPAPATVTAAFARRQLRNNVVWFRPPDADLGEFCIVCSAPATTGVMMNPAGAPGGELEFPLCRMCERPIGRPRRWAAVCALLGLFLVVPLGFVWLLSLLGVDLEANSQVIKIPLIVLFVAPFAAAAWFASYGRKLPGVQAADYRPETGETALRFDSAESARRIFRLNWPDK